MNLTIFTFLIIITIIGIFISPLAFILFNIFSSLETMHIIRIFVWIYGRGGWPGPLGHMAMRKFVKTLMAEQIDPIPHAKAYQGESK
jgi:hypothetical protein